VGGVREKVLAAHRAGLKTVLLPERNLKDLIDVPKKVRTDLHIIPITHMDEVLKVALYPPSEKPTRHKRAQAAKEENKSETAS
jgi:ATP-dependent Lon protease